MNSILSNSKKFIIPILLTLIIISFLIMPALTSAQGLKNINQGIDTTAQSAGVKGEANIVTLLGGVIQAVLGLIGLIFVVLIIYAGVQWMTAMGVEEKIAKAKKILTNSVIGLIIVMLAYSLAYFISVILESSAK